MKYEGWDVVHVAMGLANASIIAGRLETEGIPVRLSYEAVAALYGLTLDGMSQVKVLVPVEDIPLARTVLAETYHDTDLDWDGSEEDP